VDFVGIFAIPDLKVGVIATSFRTWAAISSNIYRGFNPVSRAVNSSKLDLAEKALAHGAFVSP